MPPNQTTSQIPSAHSITAQIDAQMSSSTDLIKFPSDTPKYYTSITMTSYNPWQQSGAKGGLKYSGANAATLLKDMFSSISSILPSLTTDQRTARDEALSQWNALSNYISEQLKRTGAGGAAAEVGTILLPLPVELLDGHQVKYDDKAIVPWSQLAHSLGSLIGDSITTGMGMAGLAPNAFQTIIFDRPEYKKHQLKFKLSPRTFKESESIRDIIIKINNAMSPDISGGGALFTFPNLFNIALIPNNGWLFKFKPCVLRDFVINYNGGGPKAFYHGTAPNNPPESVELTLHLWEVEYWLKGQFNADNTNAVATTAG